MWCAGDRRFIVGERYNPVCAEIACSNHLLVGTTL
jgi:hypothetical protein